ncbi:MAG: sulfatase-like hydrolase/transferase, partial [Acidobacteriota bacterium]
MAVTDGGYVSPELGFAQGFDAYYKPRRLDEQDLDLSLEKARRWMDGAKAPLFLFFHTYDAVHHPLTPRPSSYGALGLEEELGALDPACLGSLVRGPLEAGEVPGATVRETLGVQKMEEFEPLDDEGWRRVAAAYDSGLAYADERIGEWLESLDRETLVVLTSDHGEALGEHQGLAGHAYLYDLNLHVPLLMALPGGEESGRRIDRQVRSVDITPTILDALGQPVPAVDGRSLLPLVRDPLADWPTEAWATSAWQGVALTVDRRYRYILNPTPRSQHQPTGALLIARDGFDALVDRSDDPDLQPVRESFRRRVADRFEEDFRGLRVGIYNASEGSWRLQLGENDARVDLRTVKSLDAPAAAMTVTPGDTVRVEVAPRQSFDVLLEGMAASEPIAIRFSPADAPAGCPFRASDLIGGVRFTGRFRNYTNADTWYPS